MRALVWAGVLVTIAESCAGGYRDNMRPIDLNEVAETSDEETPLLTGWQDYPRYEGRAEDGQSSYFGNDTLADASTTPRYTTSDAAESHHATYGSAFEDILPSSTSYHNRQWSHRGESSRQRKEEEEEGEEDLHGEFDQEDDDTHANEAQQQPVAATCLIMPEHLSLARQAYLRTGQKGGFFMEAPMSPLQVQLLFDSEWDRRGFGYHFPPKKLAEAVSEMKLEMGYDAQIGHAASKRVRRDTTEEGGQQHIDYLRDFTTWQNRFTRKIITLRKTYAADETFPNDEDRARAVYVHFRNIVEKTYDGKRKLQDVCSKNAMQQLDIKTREVWTAFMEERIRPALGQNVDERRLPLELIEYYSRDFQWKKQKRQATTECIKRYMMQVLERDPRDSLRFTALRNEWRQELHSASRQRRKSQEGGRGEGNKGKDRGST